jgi:hypothetical protein
MRGKQSFKPRVVIPSIVSETRVPIPYTVSTLGTVSVRLKNTGFVNFGKEYH